MVVLVPAAHAVDDADALGRGSVAQHQLAGRRPAGIQQPLDFQAGVDVGVLAVTVVGNHGGIERLESGRDDDRADVVLLDRLLLVELDRVAFAAGLHATLLALAARHLQARLGIDHRNGRHGLGKRHPHRLARAQALIERIGEAGPGEHAAFDAQHAAHAQALVDVARLAADLDVVAAHRTFHRLDRRVGQQLDVGMQFDGGHLGREDARGAVERGKRLVEHGHVPANARLAFHQDHVLAGVGQRQGGLDARDAAADHERAGESARTAAARVRARRRGGWRPPGGPGPWCRRRPCRRSPTRPARECSPSAPGSDSDRRSRPRGGTSVRAGWASTRPRRCG